MHKLPIYFGYVGALPFLFVLLLAAVIKDPAGDKNIIAFLHIAYGSMILSFLGGVHWGQALPSDNKKQMSFAMVPTVACIIIMIWGFVVSPLQAIALLAGLFWLVYYADLKLMPTEFIPDGYYKFRKKLTIIVTAALVGSILVLMART